MMRWVCGPGGSSDPHADLHRRDGQITILNGVLSLNDRKASEIMTDIKVRSRAACPPLLAADNPACPSGRACRRLGPSP